MSSSNAAGDDLAFLSIREAGALIRTGKTSPVELTRLMLDRIERLNPELRAYITVTNAWAIELAEKAENELRSGHDRGPLHGIPIGLKDLYETAGVLTTAGSGVLADNIPAENATTVRKLLEGGAVVLGKHNLHEFAMGGSSMNYHYGWVRNPWNTEHSAGGSSGGTGAALAAGLCYGGMGTDTAGSIRVPAAFCGLAGMKATYGRVSVRGVIPESWTLDHAGPLARTVEDAALMLNQVAGYDPADIFCIDAPIADFTADLGMPIRGLRIGVIRDFMEDERLTPDVGSTVRKAVGVLADLGAEIDEVRIPDLDEIRAALANILRAELTVYHSGWIETKPEGYAPEILTRLKSSASLTMPGLVSALRTRTASIRRYDQLMEGFDAIVGPTVGVTAPAFEGLPERERDLAAPTAPPYARYTNVFDLTGLPVLSAPCGFGTDGLPVGLSIVGKRWDERTVLRIGHAYQQATDWHLRRPPLR